MQRFWSRQFKKLADGEVAYELDEGISDPEEDIEAAGTHRDPWYKSGISQNIKLHKKGVRCYINKSSC
jgi:hypothetical protein